MKINSNWGKLISLSNIKSFIPVGFFLASIEGRKSDKFGNNLSLFTEKNNKLGIVEKMSKNK